MADNVNFRDTLLPAQQTIHDALCDSAWLSGLKYGWNAGIIKDPDQSQAEYSKLSASRTGHLQGYREARTALAAHVAAEVAKARAEDAAKIEALEARLDEACRIGDAALAKIGAKP